MNEQANIPLGGVLRVIYFLVLAVAVVTFVLNTVTSIYDGPSPEEEIPGFSPGNIIVGASFDEEQQDYDRNLGVIFSLLGSAIMAFGVAALPRALNGARTGILGGGAIVFIAGLSYAGSGSNDWLIALWSLVGLAALLAVIGRLDEGSDWATETLTKLGIRAG